MIALQNVKKSFAGKMALSVTMDIPEGIIFGLLGTNGAGKSTLLRLLSGILRPEEGTLLVDEMPLYENEAAKQNLFLVSDDAYFSPGETALSLAKNYEGLYPLFNRDRFLKLCGQFSLDPKAPLRSFSKGMKKQVFLLLGVASGAKYLLCDETFDGLDAVMRQAIKSLLGSEVCSRPFTPIIATHNLRELEDFCDHLSLLHEGKLLLCGNLEEKKQSIFKVQCAISCPEEELSLVKDLQVVNAKHQGRLLLLTVRGRREELERKLEAFQFPYAEVIPLTLEEIFIAETEAIGYEVKLL